MKTKNTNPCSRFATLHQTGALAIMVAVLSSLHAQTLITSSTEIINPGPSAIIVDTSTSYEVADSATLTFTSTSTLTGANGGMYQIEADSSLTIGPSTPDGTGWTVFQNLNAQYGGALYVAGNASLDLTNVTFLNNYAAGHNNSTGGALYIASSGTAFLNNVEFVGNYVGGKNNGSGAIGGAGHIIMNGGAFIGNYTLLQNGGAYYLSANNANTKGVFTNVRFEGNRAARSGGITYLRGGNNTRIENTFNNSIFINNWASLTGGAFLGNAGNRGVNNYNFNYTVENGVTEYTISGNSAGYTYIPGAATPTPATQDNVRENTPGAAGGVAQAKAGGFYFASASNGGATFDIGAGATLNLGDPNAANKAHDSIASAVTSVALLKAGDGTMILNADNSYYSGSFTVNAGTLLLGNAGAKLGGVVNVTNATFGGSGTLQTFDQDDVELATTVRLNADSTLQIGANDATSAQSLAFSRTGASTLSLSGSNVTLKFDLYGSDGLDPSTYDHLVADQVIADTGTNIIDLTGLGTGTYTLISAASFTGDLGNFDYRINGGSLTARNTASLSLSGGDLMLESTFANLSMTWTGTGSALWTNANVISPNWTDGDPANPEKYFRIGDFVAFDSIADTGFEASRDITIAAEGVTVSGMTVEGGADYAFSGGNITIDAASAQPGFTGTTGRLVKSGAGTLTLQTPTNAANNFGIIEFNEGVIEFSSAAALGSGANDITVSDVTLRATNTADMIFADKLNIAANSTLTLDTTGAAIVWAGDLSGFAATGTLAKTGAGTLQFASDYSTLDGGASILINAGAIFLTADTAQLGGAVTIATGGTLGGIGNYTGSVVMQADSLLAIGDQPAAQTLAINTLTLQGATLQIRLFDDLTNDRLIIGNLASVAGTNKIDFSAFATGTFTIATASAGSLAALETAQVTVDGMSLGTRQNARLFTSGNSLLVDGFLDISRAMTWTGADATDPTLWNSLASNWNGSNNADAFSIGDRVTFNASSPAATHDITVISLRATVSDMIVEGISNYTFSGGAIVADADSVVTDSGSDNLTGATGKLVKAGSGTLTLANDGTNDFKGGIDLNGGAIVFASTGASGTTAITVATAGAGATIGAGIDGLDLANDISITAAGDTLTFETLGNSATLSGAITGAGALSIAGPGVLTLAGGNDFTGDISIASGATLAFADISALGAGSAKTLSVDNATLQLNSAIEITQTISTAAGLTIDAATGDSTISGNITGSGPFTKTGAGALTLTGTNTALADDIAIAEGRLVTTSLDAFGGSFSTTGALDIAAGASLDVTLAPPDPEAGTPPPPVIPPTNISFNRTLSGLGSLNISLSQSVDTLSFATLDAASAFEGTLNMNRGTLLLDENVAAGLASSTSKLIAGAESIVNKTAAVTDINSLTLLGGARLNLETPAGPAGSPLLTVDTLEIGSGITTIGIDTSILSTSAPGQENPANPPDTNILDQDGLETTVRIIAATTIIGGGDFEIASLDGSELPNARGEITQTGPTDDTTGHVATAIFSYGASVESDGIYAGYGLTQIEINEGKTLILDNTTSTNSTLNTALTGAGGVAISGAGLITLNKQGSYTGATTITTTGTVRANVVDVLGQTSALEIAEGSTFDLNGYAQTVRNLSGEAGSNIIVGSTLTVVNNVGTTFSGALTGGGRLVKDGPGKLLLGGVNTHGSTEIIAGALGVGADGALGAAASPLTISGPGTSLDIDIPTGITLANAINMGTNGLLINTPASGVVTLTGVISGTSQLTLEGSGTVILSGNNTFNRGLVANVPRVISDGRVNAVGSGSLSPVTLNPATTLEYRGNIITGSANIAVNYEINGGGAVEVYNSGTGTGLISFNRGNTTSSFHVGEGARVLLNHETAHGGANSPITVASGALLGANAALITTPSLVVGDDAILRFDYLSISNPTYITDSIVVGNNVGIVINTTLTGERILIESPSLEGFENLTLDPGPNNTAFLRYTDGKLRATLINMAANPGKDIATAYDSMTASMKAVYSRVSENFLLPLSERHNGTWLKAVGSFANYRGDSTKIGYREDTYGFILGYDDEFNSSNIWGLYLGYNTIDIKTVNDSTNQGKLPYGGIYVGKRWGKSLYAVADVMAGILTADTYRYEQIGYNTGTYRANMYGGTLELGCIMNSWETGSIRPSVALHYMSATYNDQDESGANPFYVADFTSHRLEIVPGLHIAQQFTSPWALPGYFDVTLGWRASLINEQTTLTASFNRSFGDCFTINCDKYSRDGIVIGLGLRVMISSKSMLGMNYDHEVSRDIARHNVNATIRFTW